MRFAQVVPYMEIRGRKKVARRFSLARAPGWPISQFFWKVFILTQILAGSTASQPQNSRRQSFLKTGRGGETVISIGIPTREYRRFLCFSSILLGIAVGIAPRLLGLAKRVIREKIGNFLNFSIFWRKVDFDLIQCTTDTQTCMVHSTLVKTMVWGPNGKVHRARGVKK